MLYYRVVYLGLYTVFESNNGGEVLDFVRKRGVNMANEELFRYDKIQRFNETEIILYKYIISNVEKIPYMTIRELASETNFSTSTIIRFCNKIGCESYKDFKIKFSQYLSERIEIVPGFDLKQLLHYFQGTTTSAFEKKIQEGAKLIHDTEMVIFVGLGSSGALARYGARYFSNFGKFSIGLEDALYPLVETKYPKISVIALSVSGETSGIIETIRKFQTHDCKILSITNHPNSTLAHISDWNISYCLETQTINGGFNATSQVPVLFLIEALARRI